MDLSTLETLFEKIKTQASLSDNEGSFPEEEFKLIRESNLLEITLPGKPFAFCKNEMASQLELLKLIGKSSLPVGRIFEGHINALFLIHLFGTPYQQACWFKDVAEDQKLFGVWNTQDANGISIHDLGNGKYRLEGAKTFCSGADWISRPLITGQMISPGKKGWQMCIVPTEKVKNIESDNSFWKPMGMRASASFRMDFTGIVLDETDLLGPPDAYYQQPYFSGGAIRFAAVQLGGAEAILYETHQFLRSLKRVDDPFQQARMAEISYLVETGNLWISQAAIKMDKYAEDAITKENLLAYINMTRTVIEEICLRCMQLSERSVGARGLMRPHALERIHRDLTTYLRQPAPDATLTAIGGYVLSQVKTQNIWH